MVRHDYISLLCTFLIPVLLSGQGFSDVAPQFGLTSTYNSLQYGGGVSFVDFNQDGLDDLSFATESGRSCEFWLNTGSGFTHLDSLVSDTSTVKQILWIDYNNDGLLDLYLGRETSNRLYRNEGALQFTDVTLASGFDFPELESYASAWFDYDKDGKLDLLVSHRTKEIDGWMDLYRNVDYTSFEKMTVPAGLKSKGESVLAMTTFDYNNDNWPDIFLGQDWEQGNGLFKNNGNGTFEDVSEESGVDFKMNSMTATVMDINSDGWQDLYVSNTMQGNVLLVNDSNGSFEEQSAEYNLDLTNVTFGTVFFDADNDGDDDFHVGGLQINHTYENIKPSNAFASRKVEWGLVRDNEFNNGVAVGDFDNDGFVDIARNSVTRGSIFISQNSLLKNEFSGNQFIKLQLTGTVSNINAIGAKVVIYTDTVRQVKRIGCGESFSSQHSLVQHFGVGQAEVIDSIKVIWPSDNVSIIYDVDPDQLLEVNEPLGGCMDPMACNYHPSAVFDNGCCRYPQPYYECLQCEEDTDEDGICDQLEVLGCTERDACNYDFSATDNDGSCFFVDTFQIIGEQVISARLPASYTYTPAPGSQVEWSIANGSIISGGKSPSVTVLWFEAEQGAISVREISSEGCVGAWVTQVVDILEAEDIAIITEISIMPNPVVDVLLVKGLKSEEYTYHVIDSQGRICLSGETIGEEFEVSTSGLSSGIYFIRLVSAMGTETRRFYKI